MTTKEAEDILKSHTHDHDHKSDIEKNVKKSKIKKKSKKMMRGIKGDRRFRRQMQSMMGDDALQ